MQMGSLILRGSHQRISTIVCWRNCNENLPQPTETVEDGSSDEDEVPDEPISPPSQNKVDEAIEILNRLKLFTADLDLDPLLQKSQTKSIKEDWTEWNNLLLVIFLKNSNYSILILIFL